MLETSPVDFVENTGSVRPACASSAGAYFLPKALIEFKVKKVVDSAKKTSYVLEFSPGAKVHVADASLPLCLDYLTSSTAKDIVLVDRTPDGLLKLIDANAEDRSSSIVSSIIDIARATALAQQSTRFRSAVVVGTELYEGIYQFDPFDQAEVLAINAAIRRYGYCFYVKGHTFRAHISARVFCGNPLTHIDDRPAVTVADRASLLLESQRGILYRPNEVHELVIMVRSGPSGWRTLSSHAIESPNAAPVFSIGVTRAFFATRKTLLKFEYGVLKDVEIDKDSELSAISAIPLKIAQAAVAIPAQVVTLRINRVNNEQALIAAQAQLIEAYREYQTARGVIAATNSPPPASPEELRRASCAQKFDPDSVEFTRCLTGT